MLKLLTKKQRNIQVLIKDYLEQWSACVDCFQQAWQAYFKEGLCSTFDFRVEQTHKEESRADDLRVKIELELYGKALLPEGRGDILGVLEAVDRLLGDAEWALFELQLQKVELPDQLQPTFARLIDVVCKCCAAVALGIEVLFVGNGDPKDVREVTEKIDAIESESDYLERTLIREIFELEGLTTGDKLLLKGVVLLLGRITDRAEHVGTRITVVSVKRRV